MRPGTQAEMYALERENDRKRGKYEKGSWKTPCLMVSIFFHEQDTGSPLGLNDIGAGVECFKREVQV